MAKSINAIVLQGLAKIGFNGSAYPRLPMTSSSRWSLILLAQLGETGSETLGYISWPYRV